MRAVLQRVSRASVTVDGAEVSSIGTGVCVLVGIGVEDQEKDIDYMVKKIANVRVFDNEEGKMWTKSLKDIGGEALCVSQFTLYGNTTKGNKPDFHLSMKSDSSRAFYERFLEKLRAVVGADRVKDGVFGAMMTVNIANDGPVTLELDSRKFVYSDSTP